MEEGCLMQEIVSLRKPREKHFKNEDGTFTVYAYDHDIHYLKNGKYVEKDNTLLEKTNTITNKASDIKLELAKRKTQKYLLKIEKQKEKITLDIKEKEINTEIKNNQITYKNLLKNIDIKYDVLDNGAKDTIILKEKENDFQKLIYSIQSDLEISKKENSILFTKNNQTIYTMGTPTLQDKEGNFYPIQYNLKDKQLAFTIEKEILENEELYPLTIDPTIEANEDNSIFDTYIYPGDENVNRNNQDFLKVGVDQNNVIYRTLMKFNLPNIGTSSDVVNASVCLTSHPNLANTIMYESEYLNKNIFVYNINQQWSEETANWNTMHNKYDERIEGYFLGKRAEKYPGINVVRLNNSYFEITNLVKQWYAGKENNGIMLKFAEETYEDKYREYHFYSKNNTAQIEGNTNPKPVFMITYRNQNGLENYMTYQNISFKEGTSYINNLTGNVTNVWNINHTKSNKFPLQLSLIYNTNDIVLENTFNLSKGYKWNYYQTLKEVNFDAICLEYLDSDGTLHYFRNQEGKIIDEDGLGLIAEKEENKYILKDKDGNQMFFTLQNNVYALTKIINTANEEMNIVHNTEGKITKLIDANKEEINIVYETNKIMVTSNYLTTTINLEKEQITSIENKYGKTNISYNEHGIASTIADTSGKKINYLYYNSSPYRLQKIEEVGLENEKGTSLEFIYEFNVTRIKDNKGRTNSYTFNNQGNTINTTNLEKEGDFQNSYGVLKEYYSDFGGTSPNTKNKLSLETTPLKYVANYLEDTSFEYGNYSNATTEEARTGTHSLKITNLEEISLPQNLNEGNYTFSAYFKTNKKATLSICKRIENSEDFLINSCEILPNEDFTRYNLTISISPKTNAENYRIKIASQEENVILYMDDMQLEEGEAANYYNLVNNSNFSQDLKYWEYDGIESTNGNNIQNGKLITLENGCKVFRMKADANSSQSLTQTIPISGKKYDTFRLSFWYKNEGIFDPGLEAMFGNMIVLGFQYPEDTELTEIPHFNLNYHATEWQFFQKEIFAEDDYEQIYLNIISQGEVNNFYFTNITLTKDVESTSYIYDDNGNLITTNNKNNGISKFKYDRNNQLTNLFEPKGNSFYFEYENGIPNQVRQGISKKGIANKIEYDINNNPVKTKIQNNDTTNLDGRSFYIRLKSSNQYIISNTDGLYASLRVPMCAKESWDFKKENDLEDYSIKSSVIPLYLRYDGTLSKKEGGDIFHIIKNNNGSYSLRHSEGDLCLTAEWNYFVATPYDKNDFNQQFYLEPIEEKEYIETSATYTSDGKFIKTTTDALGQVTKYDIDPTTGLTNSITDPNEKTTNYTYNEKDQITKVEKEGKETNYTYNKQDLLSKITCENKEYNFTYDNFLNTKEVKINNQTLVSNEYEENNGNLLSSTYGNHSKVNYTYDELDRLKTLEKNNKIYRHIYDNQNHLAKIIEGNTNYNYYYDLADRLSKYEIITQIEGNGLDEGEKLKKEFTIDYEYDLNNNVTKKTYTHKDTHEQIEYAYDEDDSLIKISLNNQNVNYIYDSLGRLKEKNINNQLPVTYEYERNGNKTSLILKRMTIDNIIYDYKYDNLYNITDIYKNKELINHYTYDSFNELIKEDNYVSNKTITYTYDNSGNILKREEYEINTDILIHEDNFGYNNTNWKDQLTKFNDTEITYDEIGNPITIGDKNLSWNARELQSYQDNMSKIEYFYNKEGIRTKKRVNNVETNYFVENSNIIMEETNGNMLYYMRTGENELIGLKYNKETYYYQKNYQGDITGIYNEEYELIATYEYDSYGKVLSIKDANGNSITDQNHIANRNPFRYRSYYYDTETKLYYLNSRYYNPEWGRFLNADNYVSTDTGLLGYNMYAYTNNSYINYLDKNGHIFFGMVLGLSAIGGALLANAIYQNSKAQKEINDYQWKKPNTPNDTSFHSTLQNNANKVKNDTKNMNPAQKLGYFVNNVKSGGTYDLKNQPEWEDKTIYYNNIVMEPQDIGNYHFGYIGRALGYDIGFLTLGAGAYQVKSGTSKIGYCFSITSTCDDPRDSYFIRLGAIAYDNEN